MSVYVGSTGRASRYAGTKATDTMYLGTDHLFPLWTPANLATPPLLIADPSTFTWSGTTFSSGTNTGSMGGSFSTMLGTPTKTAADLNGYDAITFAANSAIGLAGAATPAGNLFVFYVSKRIGSPANGLGSIISQSLSTPGWSFYDQINVSTTLSNGHSVVPGNVGGLGWPSGTTAVNKDVIANPPTDDGAYHINCGKIGTSHLWRYDGTALTPTYASDNSVPAVTGNIQIGTSYGSQNLNARVVYAALLQDPTSAEIEKLEGWAAWKYGRVSVLPSGHTYKSMAPTASAVEYERANDSVIYLPRRKLIVPDKGWRLAA